MKYWYLTCTSKYGPFHFAIYTDSNRTMNDAIAEEARLRGLPLCFDPTNIREITRMEWLAGLQD